MGSKAKAICLISGGVDSALAALLLKEQGIEVVGLNVVLPFKEVSKAGDENAAKRVARSIGIDLRIIHAGEGYVDVLRSPKYGFGSQRNPCIDCRIYMLKKAKEIMGSEGADFVATGEVLGQRPMSQRKDSLDIVERDSGLRGYLLRPISALALKPTIPEQSGIVDRNKLLGIMGRSRKQILSIAKEKGLEGFSKPAGGCLLTDPQIATRIEDLLSHGILCYGELRRIAVGRHFRIADEARLIVGRNQPENLLIERLAADDEMLIEPLDVPGPVGLLTGKVDEYAEIASAIVARYSDVIGESEARIKARKVGSEKPLMLIVKPFDAEKTNQYLIRAKL